MLTNNRLEYIDIAKGVAIILIVIGHLYKSDAIVGWLYSFHVPLFFVLSGYTVEKTKNTFAKDFSITSYIRRKAITILTPYFAYSFILCKFGIKNWLLISYGTYNTLNMAETNAIMWFLPCFFVATVVFHVFVHLVEVRFQVRKSIFLLVNVVFMTLMFGASHYLIIATQHNDFLQCYGYPFGVNVSLMGVVFMLAGYLMSKFTPSINRIKRSLPLLSLGIVIVSMLTFSMNVDYVNNGHVDMRDSIYGNYLYFMLNSTLMCAAIISVSKVLCFNKHIYNQLKLCGLNTITIMCTHMMLHTFTSKALFFIGLDVYSSHLVQILDIVSVLILLQFICPFINKYFPVLNGKTYLKQMK